MDSFELADVLAEHSRSNRLYYEFFQAPALSLGLYVLPAGAADPQSPHTEDEVYYVVNGSGMIQVGGEDRAVTAGSMAGGSVGARTVGASAGDSSGSAGSSGATVLMISAWS